MAIHPETLARIKAHTVIQEIIGAFVPLKKRGSGETYWGCCPFHSERTPSFVVNGTEGFFKCFGCGKGGDTITFLQQKEGMTYPESMRYLADKYGIPWQEESRARHGESEGDKLHILLEIAATYYQEQLTKSPDAQAYLQKRHLPASLVDKFKIGYSTPAWQDFYRYAQAKGYGQELLQQVGLLVHKEGKTYDRLRGRITFPLRSSHGQMVGIAGRIVAPQGHEPKYINPPETPLYHKSTYLYGLYEAKKEIRRQANCYLVEGYTDVIALHRADIPTGIATSGTALTEAQASLLKRFTPKVTLLFDGDHAGRQAILRGIDLLLAAALEVRVVLLPTGQDPDTYLHQYGAEALQHYLTEKSQDFITFKMYHLLREGQDPQAQTTALQSILESLALIPDPIKRAVYIQLTHKRTLLPLDTIQERIDKLIHQRNRRQDKQERKIPLLSKKETDKQSEEVLLSLLLLHGKKELPDGTPLAGHIFQALEEVSFRTEIASQLLHHFRQAWERDPTLSTSQFIATLPEALKEKAVHIISDRLHPSEEWNKRHHISLSSVEQMVHKIVQRNILHRKRNFLQELLREQSRLMPQAKTKEETDQYLTRYGQIKELELEIRKELGVAILAAK